jgi:hypothetical protein
MTERFIRPMVDVAAKVPSASAMAMAATSIRFETVRL